jgi:hypothetical protein
MSGENKWDRCDSPPPPLFVGQPERNLVKQINDEIVERMVGQTILYFPIDIDRTNYHKLYGEALEKNFLNPVRVYALVEWEGSTTESENGTVDKTSKIVINFHKRRLTEDQDLYVRVGDYIKYGDNYYELVELNEPREMFGRTEYKVEIVAKGIKVREGVFDAK